MPDLIRAKKALDRMADLLGCESVPNNSVALKAIAPLPDDADRRAREAALRDKIAKLFKAQQDEAIARITNGEAVDLAEFEKKTRALVETMLTQNAADEAARVGSAVGFEFDPVQYNQAAQEWARRYSYDLVRNLTENTRKVAQDALTQYTSTQMTKGELQALLVPAFGDVRADAIAVTETTRAYSAAQSVYQTMLAGEGVTMERVWHTDNDEIVCPICRQLNGQGEDAWVNEFPIGAPAHVNCRCTIGLRLKRTGSG
jgi:hypothetical protein